MKQPFFRDFPVRAMLAVSVLFSFGFGDGGCFPDGCENTGQNGIYSFLHTEEIPEQRIQGSPLGLLGTLFGPQRLTLNVQAQTEARGTGPAKKVLLRAFRLALTPNSSIDQDFDFLDSVFIDIEAEGQPKIQIAGVANVADDLRVVNFNVEDSIDLLPYINAGATVSIRSMGTQPERDVYFDGAIVFDIRI